MEAFLSDGSSCQISATFFTQSTKTIESTVHFKTHGCVPCSGLDPTYDVMELLKHCGDSCFSGSVAPNVFRKLFQHNIFIRRCLGIGQDSKRATLHVPRCLCLYFCHCAFENVGHWRITNIRRICRMFCGNPRLQ